MFSLVGAGGTGQVLFESMRGFQHAEIVAILIIGVFAVSNVDRLPQQPRRLAI